MDVFALYVPEVTDLIQPVILLIIAFSILCVCARKMELSVVGAGCVMLVTMVMALAPDLTFIWNRPRRFELTALDEIAGYFLVGRGKFVAFAGMSVGLIFLYLVSLSVRWRKSFSESSDVPIIN